MNDESRIDRLFDAYRNACPEVEAGANFMPNLWKRIEARHSFGFIFQSFARTAVAAGGALCLLLAVLNLAYSERNLNVQPFYADALVIEHNAENTDYAEAVATSANQ